MQMSKFKDKQTHTHTHIHKQKGLVRVAWLLGEDTKIMQIEMCTLLEWIYPSRFGQCWTNHSVEDAD